MDSQNISVRPSTPSRNNGKIHPHRRTSGGVIHENTPHTERFTIVGNDLLQHEELSGLARAIGAYIQSVPTGAPVDIKTIARKMREGTTRTAAAMRELVTFGYLRRERLRLPNGRIVTRTVFCNQPGRSSTTTRTGSARPTPKPKQAPKPTQTVRPGPRRRALPAVPQPAYSTPDLLLTAVEVLAGLRLADPRLLLSAAETEHLAPGVGAWLERDLTPDQVHRALTADLPEPLYRPAALLAHRLADRLPAPPPFRAPRQHPLQNCDVCDHAFRGPAPGRCASCRHTGPGADHSRE
ncbi:helix-turn-helix domain-containing protein [Streptomyces sp. NPDC059071]|uniref:helix-turn-helix domain-containing protein n=1 Tax=unclassified Streptomyces TaxID=2593676 RepID=UPI00362F7338